MTIKAALLDERGIFLRIDALASEAELTNRHLPTITSCDLPPGEYKWIAHTRNAYGGEFESVAWRASVEKTKREAEEFAKNPKRRKGRL